MNNQNIITALIFISLGILSVVLFLYLLYFLRSDTELENNNFSSVNIEANDVWIEGMGNDVYCSERVLTREMSSYNTVHNSKGIDLRRYTYRCTIEHSESLLIEDCYNCKFIGIKNQKFKGLKNKIIYMNGDNIVIEALL